jgi:hypothetical protein
MEAGCCVNLKYFTTGLLKSLTNVRRNYVDARKSDSDQLRRPAASRDYGLAYLIRNRFVFFRHVIVDYALKHDSLAIRWHRPP